MTTQLIEVRAASPRLDAQARQLAREILQLPMKHLPSLAAITASAEPLVISTAHLYRLSGHFSPFEADQLTQHLLVDPVVQVASIQSSQAPSAPQAQDTASLYMVDVFFHPGVTDTLAESVLAGARLLGHAQLEHVETGRRYMLDGRLSKDDVHAIAKALLYNPVIQDYHVYHGHDGHNGSGSQTTGNASSSTVKDSDGSMSAQSVTDAGVTTLPLTTLSDEQLMEVSKNGLLSLNLDEMHAIQQYYRKQGREPTQMELETLAQTWSEHCSHKTFKATINYREMDEQGHTLLEETIPGLLKHYIMRATEQIRPPWLVSAFSDNAGIVRFTETHDVAFKVETHNHPSAIEPFGGANTGVGGVIRDVLGVSAQPIACTDILCFGPQHIPAEALSEGVLSPRRIASGVVNGVRDYGNKMGVPTVNGAVLYHSGYLYNPLVFCGCLGILPHGSHPNAVQPGDIIVSLGGRTGRDGIHGATFSSGEMSSEMNARAGTAVQIGAPITEKKVTDVVIQARDRGLYHAITDCGAGGFSSAVGEMGAETGARVELERVPLKYQGLDPWEIWLSEAQERMVLAVPQVHLDELFALCEIEEVEASIIGRFTDDARLTVLFNGQPYAELEMAFLHDGRPGRTLEAVWSRPTTFSATTPPPSLTEDAGTVNTTHYAPTLLALLRHPNIASKEAIVRRYDHEVQGATVLKPLVGRSGNGPGDAAVLQPILEESPTPSVSSQAGIVLANGVNPLYGTIDPYAMAVNAVDEALRNLTAVGGDIERAALLDNFCWGNPTDSQQLGALVRAVKGCHDAALGFRTPFISGKDSLNNEFRAGGQRLSVLPTLVVSVVGVLENAAQTIDMSLKTPGNLLYQVGMTRNELAGSHYAEVIDTASFAHFFPTTGVPQVQIERSRRTMKALGEAIRRGMVRSCHDLSEGGLAVAAAEMSLAGMLGVSLDISQIQAVDAPLNQDAIEIVRLFSESASRFLVEITPEQWGAFERHMRMSGVQDLIYVGTVTNTPNFVVHDSEIELMNIPIVELQEAWQLGGHVEGGKDA